MSTFDGSPAPARGASCDHAVQFYEHDEFLFGVVAEFLASGLAAGQPAIVIATPEHREGFVRALAKKTGVQGAGGGLTLLDAREMLGTFMVGGSPDPALFRAHVGGTLESCARASDKNGSTLVHAYGEMVDLLWKDGNRQGAIRLEELWNDLAVAHRFSLLCAYAMGSFYRQSHSEDFDRICTAHGRVAAAETWRHDEHVDPMREVARLQQRALALESEVEKRDELERALREALSRRREEEGFLRSILRASDDCVKVLDLEGRLLYLSEGGCRSLEVDDPESVLGAPWLDFWTGAEREAASRGLEAARNGLNTSFEAPFSTLRTRTPKWWDVRLSPINDSNDRCERILVVSRDITARKQTEEALRRSERDLADFFENSVVGLHWVGADGVILRANQAELDLLGYARDEYVGHHISEFHADEAVIGDILNRLKRGEVLDSYEARLRCKDGTIRHVLISSNVLWRDGRFIHTRCFTRDMTPRKHAEAALRESEARFRLLHDLGTRLLGRRGLPELLEAIVDAALEVTKAPRGNLQLYDESKQTLRIVAQRGFQPQFLEHFATVDARDASACGEAIRRHERVVVHDIAASPIFEGQPSLEVMRAESIRAVQSTPIVSRRGVLLGVFSTHWSEPHAPCDGTLLTLDLLARQVADLLEQKQAEDMLLEADRRKDEFLAMLAHELRNPLAPITTALQLMMMKASDRVEMNRPLSVVKRQTEHLTRLVDDLLEVSRITRGKIRLERDVIDAARAVHRAIEISRPLIDQKRHYLAVTLPHEPVWIDADLTRLAQVLGNLLNNAAKYTDERGRIALSVESEESEVVFRVRDNGVGMSAELIPCLFDLFTQADTSLDRSQGGLGIGLTLVRALVGLHGGVVHAFSEGPGKGSEFVVRLPAALARSATKAPQGAVDWGRGRPCRIVVVDDNIDAAESLAELLTHLGHHVEVVHDGAASFESVRSHSAELVILDIGLPRIDGYEVARELRREHGDSIRLIALTGYGQEEDRRRAKCAGFDHHLVKPVQVEILSKLIADATRETSRERP